MSIPFVDRNPTENELERFRLIFSTYQDGTGMVVSGGGTLPGWRDFERSVALAFGGQAQESKLVFDVLLSDETSGQYIGLSCKMRSEWSKLQRHGRVSIELSNASGEFWDDLNKRGINIDNFQHRPHDVGVSLIETVESWHTSTGSSVKKIDVKRSSYLALPWDRASKTYQLHQFAFELPDPNSIEWSCPLSKQGKFSRRIVGKDQAGVLLEWYGQSGGQLKYYPLAQTARWKSQPFHLEPLPDNVEHGILAKVAKYFPDKWSLLG